MRSKLTAGLALAVIQTPFAIASALVTENAGKSNASGVEIESDMLVTPSKQVGVQLQHLEAKYDSFSYLAVVPPTSSFTCRVTPLGTQYSVDCAGNTPTRSPRWTIVGSLEQTIPLQSGRIVETGASYITLDERLIVKAYVDNLTNEVTIANATMSAIYAVSQIVGINLPTSAHLWRSRDSQVLGA